MSLYTNIVSFPDKTVNIGQHGQTMSALLTVFTQLFASLPSKNIPTRNLQSHLSLANFPASPKLSLIALLIFNVLFGLTDLKDLMLIWLL